MIRLLRLPQLGHNSEETNSKCTSYSILTKSMWMYGECHGRMGARRAVKACRKWEDTKKLAVTEDQDVFVTTSITIFVMSRLYLW